MAYGTPSYSYGSATSKLAENKGMSDAARNYGQFISQEKFRRNRVDAGEQFREGMPKVGSHFNRRGMYNSGLRRGGQREYAQDYQKDIGRQQWDQAAQNQGFQMAQTQSDAQYQRALMDLYEQMQVQRAAGYDPFSAVRGLV